MTRSTLAQLLRNGAVRFGGGALALLLVVAAAAPWLGTVAPDVMDSMHINRAAGASGEMSLPDGSSAARTFFMGTDSMGRDIYSRVIYGTRVSLAVGFSCALLALALGAVFGLLAGYFRVADALLMRVMDGLMAIPAILLAISLVAALGASLATVALAIAIPEVPRVARLVRSLVLTLREEAFVEAARALATPAPVILLRHILPNAMAPLIVNGTFIAASAIITESALSFLGLGLAADVPTWGGVMAEGRVTFSQHPSHVLFPALLLVPTVLAINLLGDGLRDVLDPKFSRSRGQT
jgi:peptide/nickel transport system permease protein